MSVRELDAAAKTYERLGFSPGRAVPTPGFGGQARKIAAGTGYIMLVMPLNSRDVVAVSLTDRGEGAMGISVEVEHLEKTSAILEQRLHQRFPSYAGALGRSILVPPQFTKGVWLEFVERTK